MKFEKPIRIPIATLQCEIYHYCRIHNISCCAGYKLPNGEDNLVIIKDGEIVLLVEFQDKDFRFTKQYIDKSQQKYDITGVLTMVCNKWSDVKMICEYINKKIFGNI